MKRPAGITLVEVMVILVALGMIACLFVPCFARMARHHKVEECVSHLKTLFEAQKAYPDRFPGASPARGSSYWIRLAKTQPPLVSLETLRCPVLGSGKPGECHYWGPSQDAATLGAADPLGCDQETNHSENGIEGGNILLTSGAVITDNTLSSESLWARAARLGKCAP